MIEDGFEKIDYENDWGKLEIKYFPNEDNTTPYKHPSTEKVTYYNYFMDQNGTIISNKYYSY
jgi:hypothetical protein